MELAVAPGHTLMIDGPAAVTLLQGRVEILGNALTSESRVIVRRGRRIPIESIDQARLEVTLGKDAAWTEAAVRSIPETWIDAVERITTKKGTALVIGGGDSGKTTFCTYLLNKALSKGLKVAAIDGDLGQANMGPPTTLSLGLVEHPVIDLFEIKPQKIIFVGVTSPSAVEKVVIKGLQDLRADAENKHVDLIVIDTDGWIQTELARNYKTTMVEEIGPDFVVAIQEKEELKKFLESIENKVVLTLPVSAMVLVRGREDRLLLREQGYQKYLRGSTLRTIQLGSVRIERQDTGFEQSAPGESDSHQGRMTTHSENAVPERKTHIPTYYLTGVSHVNNTDISSEGGKIGLLVGLLNREREFMGLGTIMKLDCNKGYLQIITPVKGEISVIKFGGVKLFEGHEEGVV